MAPGRGSWRVASPLIDPKARRLAKPGYRVLVVAGVLIALACFAVAALCAANLHAMLGDK